MKIVLPTSPVFTPGVAGAGTLNFTTSGLASTFEVKRVFAVINQTRNSLIFAETVANVGYTSFNATTKIMTLQADTSACSSGDTLQVIYDDPAATVAIASLPSIPAGSSSIGTVVLGAGSAAIGNVGVTGSVEIVNDVGNAIPISASALPLPAGAATNTVLTDGTQKTQVTSLPSLPTGANTIGSVNVLGGNVTAVKIDGSAVTQPVSASALPLPSGAATAAKQPALGTAGTAATDVITVQGIAGGVPQPISGTVVLGAGSAAIGTISVSNFPATQPVSGTVTLGTGSAAIGTVSVTSLPSLPTGSNTIGNVGVTGSVEITNDAGNAIPVSGTVLVQSNAGSGSRCLMGNNSLAPQGLSSVYAYGWEAAVENNDTGYGLEPIYIKVFANRSSGGGLIGSITPCLLYTSDAADE